MKSRDFENIYKNNIDSVYRYCYFLLKSKEEAQDIVSEAFTRLLQQDISKIKNEKAWLFRVSRNLIINSFRKKKAVSIDSYANRNEDENSTDFEFRDSFSFVDSVHRQDLVSRLFSYLKQIDSDTREIIVLRVWDEYKFKTIGLIVGMKEEAVKQRYLRGIKKLQTFSAMDRSVRQNLPANSNEPLETDAKVLVNSIKELSNNKMFYPDENFKSNLYYSLRGRYINDEHQGSVASLIFLNGKNLTSVVLGLVILGVGSLFMLNQLINNSDSGNPYDSDTTSEHIASLIEKAGYTEPDDNKYEVPSTWTTTDSLGCAVNFPLPNDNESNPNWAITTDTYDANSSNYFKGTSILSLKDEENNQLYASINIDCLKNTNNKNFKSFIQEASIDFVENETSGTAEVTDISYSTLWNNKVAIATYNLPPDVESHSLYFISINNKLYKIYFQILDGDTKTSKTLKTIFNNLSFIAANSNITTYQSFMIKHLTSDYKMYNLGENIPTNLTTCSDGRKPSSNSLIQGLSVFNPEERASIIENVEAFLEADGWTLCKENYIQDIGSFEKVYIKDSNTVYLSSFPHSGSSSTNIYLLEILFSYSSGSLTIGKNGVDYAKLSLVKPPEIEKVTYRDYMIKHLTSDYKMYNVGENIHTTYLTCSDGSAPSTSAKTQGLTVYYPSEKNLIIEEASSFLKAEGWEICMENIIEEPENYVDVYTKDGNFVYIGTFSASSMPLSQLEFLFSYFPDELVEGKPNVDYSNLNIVLPNTPVSMPVSYIKKTKDPLCTEPITMVWTEINGTPETAYEYTADTCNGFRCMENNTISRACYSESQCNSACFGSCLNISTLKKDGFIMTWENFSRRDNYSMQTDTCTGMRCFKNNTVTSSCYNLKDCQNICSNGTCSNISTLRSPGLILQGEIVTLIKKERYNLSEDSCTGYRCLNENEISPKCQTPEDCALSCSGQCINIYSVNASCND